MNSTYGRRTLRFLSAVGFVAAGCASTRLTSTWKDPSYTFGGPRKTLVMAVAPQATSRRVAEDAFVEKLSAHGVPGIPSYTLSEAGQLDEAGWKRLVAENNVEIVLVTRLIDIKTVEREVPPTTTVVNTAGPPTVTAGGSNVPINSNIHNVNYSNTGYGNSSWYGYYQNNYQVVTTPGYTIKEEVALIETKVYDAAASKLVWTGSSKTVLGPDQDTSALLRQFAKIVTDAIYK